ncbi:MAG: hypothetical protein IJ035_03990 [Oscillospiraceae bacterium]|nr:hypothetical protein [Oscillospiraceae bacterium]
MADERCPLCMEKLKNGECASCGYTLPNEDNISSIYDAEPAEYAEPEPIREITPEVQMEEIYPNREETAVPKFKVRTDEGKTVRTNYSADTSGTWNKPEAKEKSFTESNQSTNGNPYSGYTPEGIPNKSGGSPFANPSAYSNSSVDTDSNSAFLKKYWWLLLIAFLAPIPAVIIYSVMKSEISKYKAKHLLIIAIVLGFVLPP